MAYTLLHGADQIMQESIEKEQLNANVAGDGLQKAAAANAISVKLDGATLSVGASGLKIATGGVGTNELADNAVDDTKLDETKSYVIAGLALNGSGSNAKITNVANGTDANDAVNKSQIDGLLSGVSWREPCKHKGDHDGDNGWSLVVGDRVLDDTDNKIYTVTAGSGDGDEVTWDAGVAPQANWAVFIKEDESGWVYDSDTTTWVQFTGAGQINAGIGLSKSGNTLNLNVASAGGLQVTGVDPNDDLSIKLDGATLALSASGIKIADGGVDTLQLAADAVDATILDEAGSYTIADVTISNLTASQYIKTDAAKKLVSLAQIPISDTNLTASNGIKFVTNDLQIDLSDTNPSLEVADGGLRAKVDDSTIERSASGLQLKDGGITEAKLAASVELGFEQTRVEPNESPNSVLTTFTWSFGNAILGSELVHYNGVLMQGVAGDGVSIADDYEIAASGGTTTVYFAKAPKTNSRITITCRVSGEA